MAPKDDKRSKDPSGQNTPLQGDGSGGKHHAGPPIEQVGSDFWLAMNSLTQANDKLTSSQEHMARNITSEMAA
ncbi:hypothetical protein COLO4_32141 [Corchorus olitorius]|uniref:Uncharacterized protein n=1 Tax=Corchorus olitorius TaxID=93759 RepID=A0A1R3H106_9ROSI|nr:hypothetical protein COLO4_32141 [Corchorus olitorius]